MSHPDEEELVDFEPEEETTSAAPTAAAKTDGDKKGSYVGIHSTGFRFVHIRFEGQPLIGEKRFPVEAGASARDL